MWLYLTRSNPENISTKISKISCKHGRGAGGDCSRNNVGYELYCDDWGPEKVCYVGETAQNTFTRGLKHTREAEELPLVEACTTGAQGMPRCEFLDESCEGVAISWILTFIFRQNSRFCKKNYFLIYVLHLIEFIWYRFLYLGHYLP